MHIHTQTHTHKRSHIHTHTHTHTQSYTVCIEELSSIHTYTQFLNTHTYSLFCFQPIFCNIITGDDSFLTRANGHSCPPLSWPAGREEGRERGRGVGRLRGTDRGKGDRTMEGNRKRKWEEKTEARVKREGGNKAKERKTGRRKDKGEWN